MISCLKLFVLSSFISYSLADPYNCAGTQTIDPPTNISNPRFYPKTWNDSQSAPQYVAGQNCTWTINVPKGMFAYLAMKANTSEASLLRMKDSVGYVSTIKITSMEPYYLMDPSFTIDLQAFQTGTLGIRIQWFNINPNVYPTTWKVHANGSPLTLFGGDFDNSTVIQSDSRVSLLALPPNILMADVDSYLGLTQVFNGPSINSTHIGNLYQIMASGNNYVSTGKFLTLYTLFPGFTIGNYVILQDYFNVKDFKSYKAIICLLPNYCQVTLDATNGTAAAIRYYPTPSFFVTKISMPDTNVLSVYTDFVTEAHKLADYTSTTAKTNIPQKFSGRYTTFVLNQGQANIELSSNSLGAQWGTAFDGRRGFFASPKYATNTSDQSFSDQIIAPKTSEISYTVDRSAILGGAILEVTIFSNQKTVVDNVYSVSNFPGGYVKSTGDNILVKYQSNGAITTGPFVSFRFEKYNSAASKGILVGIICSIWMAIYF